MANARGDSVADEREGEGDGAMRCDDGMAKEENDRALIMVLGPTLNDRIMDFISPLFFRLVDFKTGSAQLFL
jgi:hypothetical protein